MGKKTIPSENLEFLYLVCKKTFMYFMILVAYSLYCFSGHAKVSWNLLETALSLEPPVNKEACATWANLVETMFSIMSLTSPLDFLCVCRTHVRPE